MIESLLPGIGLVNGDCANILPLLPPADLILTSPPYGSMREYGGFQQAFDFASIASAIVANLTPGGVLVWIVGDQVVDGDESFESLHQALAFKALGLKAHQRLIFHRWSTAGVRANAYYKDFVDMYVFSKGKPKVVNLLHDRKNQKAGRPADFCNRAGRRGDKIPTYRGQNGKLVPDYSNRGSIWSYPTGMAAGQKNGDLTPQELSAHPAIFPIRLAIDHILSWTNSGDLVIDPMAGSGTTLRAAADLERRAIGVEINPSYCALIRHRLSQAVLPMENPNDL